MTGADRCLDGCDLRAATRDSRCPLLAFLGDLLERPPVAVECGVLARQRLPALNNYIDVLRIERESPGETFARFLGIIPRDLRGAAASGSRPARGMATDSST